MGLDVNFADAKKTVTTTELDVALEKTKIVQIHSSKGSKSEGTTPGSDVLTSAKANHE